MWHERPDTQLVAPGDTTFWQTLWRSAPIQALMEDPHSGYASVLAAAARLPWWFYTPQHAHERRHFSAWFGQAIGRRHYDNPVLEDLYVLHDVLHALTFVDDPQGSESAWRARMRANEILVSLETEALIYHRAPGLRAVSFAFPIAVDQWQDSAARLALQARVAAHWPALQQQPAEQALMAGRPDTWPLAHPRTVGWSADTLWAQRRVITHHPDKGLTWERWITQYEGDAVTFYDTWAPWWRHIETERVRFAQACAQGQWQAACRAREALWAQHADAHGVPYGFLAEAAVVA